MKIISSEHLRLRVDGCTIWIDNNDNHSHYCLHPEGGETCRRSEGQRRL